MPAGFRAKLGVGRRGPVKAHTPFFLKARGGLYLKELPELRRNRAEQHLLTVEKMLRQGHLTEQKAKEAMEFIVNFANDPDRVMPRNIARFRGPVPALNPERPRVLIGLNVRGIFRKHRESRGAYQVRQNQYAEMRRTVNGVLKPLVDANKLLLSERNSIARTAKLNSFNWFARFFELTGKYPSDNIGQLFASRFTLFFVKNRAATPADAENFVDNFHRAITGAKSGVAQREVLRRLVSHRRIPPKR